MHMKHLLIEGYCNAVSGNGSFPCKNTWEIGIYCISCSEFSYTKCPNEIAISNQDGVVESQEDWIGFGGEMEPEHPAEREEYLSIWKTICREKRQEAYDQYMKMRNSKARPF